VKTTLIRSLLGLCCVLLCATCRTELNTGGGRRGVLVVAIDALRADHLSAPGYDYDRETTPFLHDFAQDAITFSNAWSTAPQILPAHVSLLTGCDPRIAKKPPFPQVGGRLVNPLVHWLIPEGVPRVALEFLAAGWTTAAFVDHPWIRGMRGFDKGFRDYLDFGGQAAAENTIGFRGVGSRFFQWLRERRTDEDWFAYVHMNDLVRMWERLDDDVEFKFDARAELNWVPPIANEDPTVSSTFFAIPRTRSTDVQRTLGEYEAIYDSALWKLDKNLERLFGHLAEFDCWENTTIVVVGSFGFGFGDSGFVLDHGTLSDADLHVPLLVRPAASLKFERARVSSATVSLTDVAPTVLSLAGIVQPAGMHGRSLVGILDGKPAPAERRVFASSGVYEGFCVIDERYCFEASYPGSRGPGALSESWFGDRLSHREELREALHDRVADPAPSHLGPGLAAPEIAQELRTAGETWYALVDRARDVLHLDPFGADRRDPEEIAELRRLGVVGELR